MKPQLLLLAFFFISFVSISQRSKVKRRTSFAYSGSSKVADKIEDALGIDRSKYSSRNTIVLSFDKNRYIKYEEETNTYFLFRCPVNVYVDGEKCSTISINYIPEKRDKSKSYLEEYANKEAEKAFLSLSTYEIKRKLNPCINYRTFW